MSRPSIMLIAAGAAGLLVALVLLYQSTRSDAVPLQPAETARAESQTAAPPVVAPSPTTPDQPAAAPARPTGRAAISAPTAPRLEAVMPSAAEPSRPLTNDGIQFGAPQLHAQTSAVEPLVRECVEKAAIAGDKPNGTAVLTYVVAHRGDKFIVEAPGTEPDKTTIENERLLECMAGTAKAMKFEGLPRGAQEIYVTRKVTLEAGKLTEYKHVAFSYLR